MLLELASSVLVALEQVETCTAWTQQYSLSALCCLVCLFNALLHGVCVDYGYAESTEEIVQLAVIGTQEDECAALFLYKVGNLLVVIALVLTTQYEHGLFLHAL